MRPNKQRLSPGTRGLGADEMVVFSDAVHPEHQSRPAHGWFPKGQKTALKAASGRKRLNIQGALDLETFQFTFVEGEKINAETTRQMLEKLEAKNPAMKAIHVFLDNARYHHAKILKPWLESSERRIKLHFLPPYAPHLNPIERLWSVMHKWVTTIVTTPHSTSSQKQFLGSFAKPYPNSGARSQTPSPTTFGSSHLTNTTSSEPSKLRSIQAEEYTIPSLMIWASRPALGPWQTRRRTTDTAFVNYF